LEVKFDINFGIKLAMTDDERVDEHKLSGLLIARG